MKEADQKRCWKLHKWSQNNGARLHPSLEIYYDDVTKFSLRVKNSVTDGVEPGFTAVTSNIAQTLSYINAVIDGPIRLPASHGQPHQPAFPPRFMTDLPPFVIGRFFLIKEYLKGDESFWWPYIATLPQPEHVNFWALPAFWPEEDIAFLDGTNAYVACQEIQQNVKQEYKQARKVLKEAGFAGWQDYTQMLYKWAFCIFTSRSFRPSLMLSQNSRAYISALLPQGCEIDDFSILQPLFDLANHSMTAKYSWDITSDPQCCQLICEDGYQAGDQVYNNYGLKSNSELLLGYGFILPETEELHNDYVHVRKRQPQAGDASAVGKPKDFLISLRPMNHPSSVAGRARLFSLADRRLLSLQGLSHFEPALIADLAAAVATPEERALIGQWLASEEDAVPEGLGEVLDKIRGPLGGKVHFDYQKLKAAELDEETGENRLQTPTNKNQELALEYRRQCEKVLVAALEALSQSMQ
ncbi:ribosomal lysine N-methyltransferase set10 [Cladorrhinum sp. PSN259]|nr:ribosomal lysine N-methyltransferase set10 [Cladorrhinum sp. PSN259]